MFVLGLFNFSNFFNFLDFLRMISFELSSSYLHPSLQMSYIIAKSFQGFGFAGIVYAPVRDNPEIRLLDG